jgi:hypothetical protein
VIAKIYKLFRISTVLFTAILPACQENSIYYLKNNPSYLQSTSLTAVAIILDSKGIDSKKRSLVTIYSSNPEGTEANETCTRFDHVSLVAATDKNVNIYYLSIPPGDYYISDGFRQNPDFRQGYYFHINRGDKLFLGAFAFNDPSFSSVKVSENDECRENIDCASIQYFRPIKLEPRYKAFGMFSCYP